MGAMRSASLPGALPLGWLVQQFKHGVFRLTYAAAGRRLCNIDYPQAYGQVLSCMVSCSASLLRLEHKQ